MAKTLIKRASKMSADKVKKYSAGHLYIVDYCDADDAESTRSRIGRSLGTKKKTTDHETNCENIKTIFQNHTDYKVHDVKFPKQTSEESVYKFFENEVKKLTSDELMIVYFHGKAGYGGPEYAW